MKRKRRRKGNRKITSRTAYKQLDCNCGTQVEVQHDTKTVICPRCAVVNDLRKFGLPKAALPKKEKVGPKRPRGWHFMKEYIDPKGNVFHKGIEQPGLKGTKSPTQIKEKKKKKPRLTKRQKSEMFAKVSIEINSLRKDINKIISAGKKRGIKKLEKQVVKKRKELKKYL